MGTADRRLNAWPSPFETMLEKHGGVELREAYDGAPRMSDLRPRRLAAPAL